MNKEDNVRKLREENNETIIEYRNMDLNWDRFKRIIVEFPLNLDKDKQKEILKPKDRLKYEVRDKGRCYICGSIYPYGSCNVYLYTKTNYKLSHLHHIIPNGSIEDSNIITLCTHCHQMVHQALYINGVWNYARPL